MAVVLLLVVFFLAAPPARAGEPPPPSGPSVELPEILVPGRSDDLVGVADSATAGTVGADELRDRPVQRPGEVVEMVPGMVITQHAGGGKANQYYLRGFNLDHGTDFAFYVDGVPINLPSHAHGQGYTDLNWIIPELIEGIEYKKGVYYAEQGDFGNTGMANLKVFDVLPGNLVQVGAGSLGYARALAAGSPKLGAGHLLYGVETESFDGAWTTPDELRKVSAILKYSLGNSRSGLSLTGQGYYGSWKGTDQIPLRAITGAGVGPGDTLPPSAVIGNRYGTIDPSTGGTTDRFSLVGEYHRQDDESATKLVAYVVRYDLDLYSDFTYFINQAQGDEFRQHDNGRYYAGLRGQQDFYGKLFGREMENTVGLQARQDWVELDLDHVEGRVPFLHVSTNDVSELNVAPWFQNRVRWLDWLRSEVGVRADGYYTRVTSDFAGNSGHQTDGAISPKATLVFGPWDKTEYYLQAGLGFRTNDARGVFTTTAPAVYNGTSYVAQPSNAQAFLVHSKGGEIGVRSAAIPKLNTTLSLWALHNDSDTFFDADTGSLEDIDRPSLRTGIEWTNFYSPLPWLTVDADFAYSWAYFTDGDPNGVGIWVPEAVRAVVSGAISVEKIPGFEKFFASLRYRYFGPRPLVENNSQQSQPVLVFNLLAGYHLDPTWTVSLEILNLFDAHYNDADYYDVSRLQGEPAGPNPDGSWNDHLVHAGDPFNARLFLTANF